MPGAPFRHTVKLSYSWPTLQMSHVTLLDVLNLECFSSKIQIIKWGASRLNPGLNVLQGEKCLKLATLRLIADNISFLGGRLDQARIVERVDRGWEGCSWSSLVLVMMMVRSNRRIGCQISNGQRWTTFTILVTLVFCSSINRCLFWVNIRQLWTQQTWPCISILVMDLSPNNGCDVGLRQSCLWHQLKRVIKRMAPNHRVQQPPSGVPPSCGITQTTTVGLHVLLFHFALS